jgi:Domain of unknown function (DUF4232)
MALAEMMLLAVLLAFHAGSPAACKASQLQGNFTVVRGSAGAGNIVYRLRVVNISPTTCFVSGLPVVRLLGKSGKPLPTNVRAAQPGMGTAARIVLASGEAARADARFSPDVPGPGEPVLKYQCEPTAYKLRVTAPGGGTFIAPIAPPTPVCEHGTLSFKLFSRA